MPDVTDTPRQTKTTAPCAHRRLLPGSGGYYIFCDDCGHAWACENHHEPHGRCADGWKCQTPLQTGDGIGRWVWQEDAPYAAPT